MPKEDADRWNQRYQSSAGLNAKAPVPFLMENLGLLPTHGIALDIAMGSGRNSEILVNHGLSVIGIDISLEAAINAKLKCSQINAIVADLTEYALPPVKFDVILNFYYLQRELIKILHRYIKPNGLIIIETLTGKMNRIKPETPEEFLLKDNELPDLLGDHWRIIKFQEGWFTSHTGKQKAVASLIGQFIP